jgi:hypothetical protein
MRDGNMRRNVWHPCGRLVDSIAPRVDVIEIVGGVNATPGKDVRAAHESDAVAAPYEKNLEWTCRTQQDDSGRRPCGDEAHRFFFLYLDGALSARSAPEGIHMNRGILMSICIGAVALTPACSRRDNGQGDRKNIVDLATHPVPPGSIAPVTVDGCLTASGDRFMLASLDKDSSKTMVYQLVNADDQLRNLVGKQVRVTGEAQATQSAETREVTPPAPAATAGKSGPAPTVSTVEDTKLDVHKMTVASVTPTGDTCAH